MELREASDGDSDRIRELARSTMTATYALSPQQLDAIVEARFGDDALPDAVADRDIVTIVAENGMDDSAIVGFALGTVRAGNGEIEWLFVDPERRGGGIGTELFETAAEALREQGGGPVSVVVLQANTEGSDFAERLGYEQADERTVEIGDQSFVGYVHAEDASEPDGQTTQGTTEDVFNGDLPGADERDDALVASTDDGTTVFLDTEETESGAEGPFLVGYTDEANEDRYGYYCGNCGSLDPVADESERIECPDCGNAHTPRSAEAYDDSYL
jgi:ribosomal protein S18 acetylase RimI-like enzyme